MYENVTKLLAEFLEDVSLLEARKNKHRSTVTQYEKELRRVFDTVERHSYVTTLRFVTAEEYMEYIFQVCKSVETELEQRREAFLTFLRSKQNAEGQYEFVRDTYLYRCGREV